ncbi:MAG: hypothetical protein HYS60_02795 [Candidatus Wildermuthbacteria bacterium]|nr:hypothetical protein [Candidatus Wildermuthbacteria bacterium]
MKRMENNNAKTPLFYYWVVPILVGVIAFPQFFDIEITKKASIPLTQVQLESMVLPADGILLPIVWDDLGKQMLDSGVIDQEKFESIYGQRGGLDEYEQSLLSEEFSGSIVMTQENSGFLLNLFWAFGLANKNDILEQGPMMDARYGGAENFASTGGWTLSQGSVMEHYSRYSFVVLSQEQQALVENVSKNIYRPCCNNPTYFPDCNHGMAMLGLLELMAGQGVSEEEMYRVALQVNSYWFPDTYLAIAQYLDSKGIDWNKTSPKELLGYNFSSASGYRQILSQITPPSQGSSGGCGI